MSESKDIYLGFDPGAVGNFGWSICQEEAGQFNRSDSGTANYAMQALQQMRDSLALNAPGSSVVALGIDAPLLWNDPGQRSLDRLLRQQLAQNGHANVHGIVQHINSLRGGCLAQGIMLLRSLPEQEWFQNCRITESHPKALRLLLADLPQGLNPRPDVRHSLNARLVEEETVHEWDARCAAYTAFAMCQQPWDGWRDLYQIDDDLFPVFEVNSPLSYWMPVPALQRLP